MNRRDRGERWSVPLVVALVVAFWVTRLVLPGRSQGLASGDLRFYFYPTYEAFFGLLRRGRFVAWNPYQLCGIPWLGTVQAAFFYPPHVLYLLLPTRLALGASSLLHLILIALTTLLFVRRAGLGGAAALIAVVVFTLRGTVPEWVRWPYLLEAIAWLPLGCIALLDIVGGPTGGGVALLATATGMSWLAGGPQATVFILYTWPALLLALLLGARVGPGRWLAAGTAAAAGIGLGTLVGAVEILPGLDLAREGTRATHRLDLALLFQFGDPGLSVLRDLVTGSALSFGVIGLALAPAALLERRHRTLVFWALTVGGLAFMFSLGPATPLFRAYLDLPALAWFRTPHRIRVLSDFSLAVLAAVAVAALFERSDGRPVTRWLPAVSAGALTLCALLRGSYPATLVGAAAVGVVLWCDRRAAAALVTLAVVEVFLVPASGALLPYDAASAASYRRGADAYAAVAAIQGHARVWFVRSALPPPWLTPRLATVYGVRSIDDYEPVTLRRQAEYFNFLLEGRTRSGSTFQGRLPEPVGEAWSMMERRRLLDVAGVRYLVGPANTRSMLAIAKEAGLTALPAPGPELSLWENPRAVPRAYVAYHAEPAPAPDVVLARMADPAFDPMRTTYVEGDVVLAGSAPPGHAAEIVRDEEELVEVDATLAAPGLVVLADTYYPRWRASIDGVPASIVPANHLFRAVAVPAGHHRVRFAYDRGSLRLGAGVTVAAALAIGLLLIRPARVR
jgi:hypothetical protein